MPTILCWYDNSEEMGWFNRPFWRNAELNMWIRYCNRDVRILFEFKHCFNFPFNWFSDEVANKDTMGNFKSIVINWRSVESFQVPNCRVDWCSTFSIWNSINKFPWNCLRAGTLTINAASLIQYERFLIGRVYFRHTFTKFYRQDRYLGALFSSLRSTL